MKLSQPQIQRLVEKVIAHWKSANLVIFKEDEAKVVAKAVEHVKKELQKEVDLDREVNRMLDELERSNAGEFSRYKMFPILKQKLAKEKKVIL